MDKIAVLDFGSQYSHLICRRIRDFEVHAVLLPHDISADKLRKEAPSGVVLSGGPSSVYKEGAPRPGAGVLEIGLPILGICYGHQVIVDGFGGKVRRANREYGSSLLSVDDDGDLLGGLGGSFRAWMSHGDEAEQVPPGFEIMGHTGGSSAAVIADRSRSIYGIQFHPEVAHTEQGSEILRNFVLKICGAKQEWTMDAFIDDAVDKMSGLEGNILCGVSGGIDSTVTALLIHKAVGDRLKCVFVDNGLLRHNEEAEVERIFKEEFGMRFTALYAAERFLEKLKGITDPEEKRKVVGGEFADVFSEYAEKNGPFRWLAQGTLYPDVVESGATGGPAAVIKSHHNVGGLPDRLGLEILEPLRELYKDEVRKIAARLGVPPGLVSRHPFPGPGLAVRIMGEVTPRKLGIAKAASKIVEEELEAAGLYDTVWQAYAAVGDDRAVGVVGDERRHGSIVTIRVVESLDAMTADWSRLPHGLLEKMSNRITNEIEEVTWVTYAISSKPPATIEPQ
ncbi:GMP synthase, PP-ATPase domain/subunit [Cenarchaeum symbiosum A]|uniref:GMP synthase [glutamine-hydrolyzing] n=1 Tax=Cenarchaeum symbiosum (strain A) TaxID=414004 RepID=A0RZ40_CENSY|nr:GMP synthase, PP-ATPase domain/subunit [Cenarchaeum symbiosum A]